MRFEAGVFRAAHDPQEHRLAVLTIVGKMSMWLTKGRHDLRHLKPEQTVRVRKGRSVAVPVPFVAFGGMGPDLYPLSRQRHAVARTPNCSGHPEVATTNFVDNVSAGLIIVGPPRMDRVAEALWAALGRRRPPAPIANTAPLIVIQVRHVILVRVVPSREGLRLWSIDGSDKPDLSAFSKQTDKIRHGIRCSWLTVA